jgi:PAS domain S-box-containing protein
MPRGGPNELDTSAARAEDESVRQHFQQLVAGVKDYAIFMLDAGGHVITWNEGAQTIKGYRAEEIIGQHYSRFYPPETLARHWPDQELKIAAGQGRIEDEGWRVRKDGSRFWANVVITALRSPSGALTGFLKVTRDLTERRRHEDSLRESEERFRLLVQGIKDYAIFMLDPQGHVASWNAGAERIKGYAPAEIIGRHFSCFYPAEVAAGGKPAAELAAAIEHGSIEDEGWRIRKDGSRFWADVIITAVYDDSGCLRGFAKITRDVTERKQVEALEESHQRIHEFLAMLSHELRNPLAPLKTSADILSMRDLHDPIVQRASGVIARQVQHLTRLTNDLLDVGRITSGRITLSTEPLEIRTAITRAVEATRPLIDLRSHSLKISLPDQPLLVAGDLTRLTQVLVNLLNNAAKYTAKGGRIEVSAAAENRNVLIRVRDTGRGITPDLLPRIFDLFTQGPRALDRSDGGLGVGLALVHRLVALHNGTVTAYSEGIGRGSEFVVCLPLYSAEAAITAVPEVNPSEQAPARRRVMVVDDNRDAAESMSMLLELWDNEVACAYDGPSALEIAAKLHPQAVFLDIGLPGMDGYEIAGRLREMPQASSAVLIAVTGYGQADDRRRARRAGFDHHLIKPVAPDTLHALLDSLDLD